MGGVKRITSVTVVMYIKKIFLFFLSLFEKRGGIAL